MSKIRGAAGSIQLLKACLFAATGGRDTIDIERTETSDEIALVDADGKVIAAATLEIGHALLPPGKLGGGEALQVWADTFAVGEESGDWAEVEAKLSTAATLVNLSVYATVSLAPPATAVYSASEEWRTAMASAHWSIFESAHRLSGTDAPAVSADVAAEAAAQSANLLAAEHTAIRSEWSKGENAGGGLAETVAARVHPIRAEDNQRNILITSALPYVNNVPHLGNIIGCVLSADVFSRFCRARNYNVLYVSGTDEYGTATEARAQEEGVSEQVICDRFHHIHADIYRWFDIDFDYFGRTSTPEQTETAQSIFTDCDANGFITSSSIEQFYCDSCESFLADRFLRGTCPHCHKADSRGDQCDACGKLIGTGAEALQPPITCARKVHAGDGSAPQVCRNTPNMRTSRHLFLSLDKLQESLLDWSQKSSEKGAWTSTATKITSSWLKGQLHERCISRDLRWGIPVPKEGFQSKVFYVWFDAPIGYHSITRCYSQDVYRSWWHNPDHVQLYQFMAKDNVPFHSVMFPASLIAAGGTPTMLHHLNAIEYLQYEGTKFSKSNGVGVFGDKAKQTKVAADIFRFYLLSIRPENADTDFSWQEFVDRANGELVSNFGNFCLRSLTFCFKFFEGVIVRPDSSAFTDDDIALIAAVNKELREYIALLEAVKLRDAIRVVMNVSRLGNGYMQAQQAWTLVKNEETKGRAHLVISLCVHLTHLLGSLMQPYMPSTADKLVREQLCAEPLRLTERWVPSLADGHRLPPKPEVDSESEPDSDAETDGELLKRKVKAKPWPRPLFKTIRQVKVDKWKANFGGDQKKADPAELVRVEAEIKTQAEKVRTLKESGTADAAAVKVEVDALLALKKRLAELTGEAPAKKKSKGSKGKGAAATTTTTTAGEASSSQVPVVKKEFDPAEKARLDAAIAAQALKVRVLKEEVTVDADAVKSGVDVLLLLKKELAELTGEPVDGGKKKKNKKK